MVWESSFYLLCMAWIQIHGNQSRGLTVKNPVTMNAERTIKNLSEIKTPSDPGTF